MAEKCETKIRKTSEIYIYLLRKPGFYDIMVMYAYAQIAPMEASCLRTFNKLLINMEFRQL